MDSVPDNSSTAKTVHCVFERQEDGALASMVIRKEVGCCCCCVDIGVVGIVLCKVLGVPSDKLRFFSNKKGELVVG